MKKEKKKKKARHAAGSGPIAVPPLSSMEKPVGWFPDLQPEYTLRLTRPDSAESVLVGWKDVNPR